MAGGKGAQARRRYNINRVRRQHRRVPKWVQQNGGWECRGCGVWNGAKRHVCLSCYRRADELDFGVPPWTWRGFVGAPAPSGSR